jgi:hypothetical protein
MRITYRFYLFALLSTLNSVSQIPIPEKLTDLDKYNLAEQEYGTVRSNRLLFLLSNEIVETYDGKSVMIVFPDDLYSERQDLKYAIGYILNNSSEAVEIKMIDAAVDKVKEYYFINDKWINPNQEVISVDCGNSYYSGRIDPGNKFVFQINIGNMAYGNIKTKYKIGIELDGKEVLSNEIVVNLHENQIKSLASN